MEFDQFLKAALPPLRYDWRRHRRKGVRRKVLSRTRALGIEDLSVYLDLLGKDPAELAVFKGLLTVTISRFYRDPPVFDRVRDTLFPRILGMRGRATIWSAGSASGEEPYTVAMVAERFFPGSDVKVVATDIDAECMARAKAGLYGESSLKNLPQELRGYFTRTRDGYLLHEAIKKRVLFLRHDILDDPPFKGVDIVLCRNLAYTYFGAGLRMEVTRNLHGALLPGGFLVLGRTEFLPHETEGLFAMIYPEEKIYCKI